MMKKYKLSHKSKGTIYIFISEHLETPDHNIVSLLYTKEYKKSSEPALITGLYRKHITVDTIISEMANTIEWENGEYQTDRLQ